MRKTVPLVVDDVPLVVEALRAYSVHLAADATAEPEEWLAEVFGAEALHASALADTLLGDLRRWARFFLRLPAARWTVDWAAGGQRSSTSGSSAGAHWPVAGS